MSGKCPVCGHENLSPTKTWTMKGRVEGDPDRNNTVTIEQYKCEKCGKAFRKGVPKT